MTENPADFIPIWMILSAAFGFVVGELCGDYRRHRHCLEEANEELHARLDEAAVDTKPIHRALKEQRGVINDIRTRLLAVSKPSKIASGKSHRINGPISPIRPFKKV